MSIRLILQLILRILDLITYELDIVQDAEGNNVLTTNIQKHDVTTVLPSANITFHYSEEFLIRTAAYRAMSRPQLLDMSWSSY